MHTAAGSMQVAICMHASKLDYVDVLGPIGSKPVRVGDSYSCSYGQGTDLLTKVYHKSVKELTYLQKCIVKVDQTLSKL